MKKKAVILLAGLFALLGAACLSMARVMHGEEYVAAARAQSLYKLDIAQSRGTIYDCGLQPLVGGETEYVAAVAPTIQAIGALEKATGGQYRQQLAVALENGRPFQLVLEQPVDNPLVQVFRVPQRYSQEQLAPHVVGYLDSLGGGAAGIELAMDDVLSQCGGEISVTYRVDAVGRVIGRGGAPGGEHPGGERRRAWPSPWTAPSSGWPSRPPKSWAKGPWWSPRRRGAKSGRWPACRTFPPWI